jgi:serine/threonine protein kinase/tetratricopeptide (TPR) repeat protein/TolB-like protein
MERAKAIYDYAVDLQPEERELFLRQISSEDPELLQQVQRMLEHVTADTEEITPTPLGGGATAPAHKYIFSPGDLIAGRYRVLRKVAKGGMGEVYEVHDLELHSRVALKVISLKSAAKPNSAEMFRREILLARQVTHPNVCRIYDIGRHEHPDHGELLFLTMEFLEGTTLADRVRTQGPVVKEDALSLIQQMIQALAAAHRLNIAHRDFKSGNVILCEAKGASGSDRLSTPSAAVSSRPSSPQAKATSGSSTDQAGDSGSSSRSNADSSAGTKKPVSGPVSSGEHAHKVIVKVTDFGLARSVDGMETTFQGEVWGTPDYMAPEQFHGQSSIASDIYALGVVIYEMFTAKLPHRSSSGTQTADGKPSAAMEMIPAEWRPVVKKCMAFDPTDRYATVQDVWAALNGDEDSEGVKRGASRRLRFGWASALVVILGITAWMNRGAIRRWFNPVPEQKHIAVLQFENIGDDAANKAFAAGVGETLASRLSQLGADGQLYWVVPFSDSRKYTDVEQARRNLDVTLVVSGTVQRTGDAVRLTVNVIDARKHKQLASHVMTASMADLNLLQDEAWESVAGMVQQPVDPGTKKTLDASSTKNARAYEYYEQGVGYLQRGDLASVNNAIDAFKKSVAEDPTYALAQAGLGNAYAIKYYLTKDSQWINEAKNNADAAVKLNPNLSTVHEALGKVYEFSGQLDESKAEYRRALELNPMAISASVHIAKIDALQGKYAEAEAAYKATIARMPAYFLGYAGLGRLYYEHGRFTDAAKQFQQMIDRVPDNPLGYQNLGAAYEQMGDYPKAITTFKKGLEVKQSAELWSDLGTVYMFTGENSRAAEAMQKAVEINPHDHTLWRNLADSYRQVPSLSGRASATYQKAAEVAQEQLAVNPKDKDALSGIALYQAHLGNRAEAQKYITKALQEGPQDSDVLFTAALVYEIIGERGQAITELQKSLGAGFSPEDVKREPELQALRSDPKYRKMLGGAPPIRNN